MCLYAAKIIPFFKNVILQLLCPQLSHKGFFLISLFAKFAVLRAYTKELRYKFPY